MAPAQSKPTLLTIPRELRDIIYGYIQRPLCYVAVHTDRVSYTFTRVVRLRSPELRKQIREQYDTPLDRSKYRDTNAGILLACKQPHDEALSLYYSCSIFLINDARRLRSWALHTKIKSELVHRIKTIRICHRREGWWPFVDRLNRVRSHLEGLHAMSNMIETVAVKIYFGGRLSRSDQNAEANEESYKYDSSDELWVPVGHEAMSAWEQCWDTELASSIYY